MDSVWTLLPHCLSVAKEILGFLPEPGCAFGELVGARMESIVGILGIQPWIHVEVSARAPVKRREFRVHCERGVAWLDEGWADHIKVAADCEGRGGDADSTQMRPISTELPLFRELRTFIQHLQGGPIPRSTAFEAFETIACIDRMRHLASSHA